MLLSLCTAREAAAKAIKKAQKKYKAYYDQKSAASHLRVGNWGLVKFTQKESKKYGSYHAHDTDHTGYCRGMTQMARSFVSTHPKINKFKSTYRESPPVLVNYLQDSIGMVPRDILQIAVQSGSSNYWLELATSPC